MADTHLPVVVRDVLDPVTGRRADIEFDVPGVPGSPVELDGQELWSLPGLYDADAHTPVLLHGLRELDRLRALAGGATHVNIACPWHLVRDRGVAAVGDFFATTSLPRFVPILSVSDTPSSEGFADWLTRHGEELCRNWMPTIKLYSNDPYFWPNLEAIWAAGARAAIYFYTEQDRQRVLATSGGPVHFRHVTSRTMAEQIAARPDSTSQTSPHFLMDLPDGRAQELFVLPPVPGGADRASLIEVVGESVDFIASDHNAPVAGNEGPGLELQQHFLPTLLTLADDGVLDLARLLQLTTVGPAATFGSTRWIGESRILVDPRHRERVSPWPGQEARRAPFRDLSLVGAVVAAIAGGQGRFL